MKTTRLREVPVEEAVGLRLAHDLTQIIPGQFKGRLFRKGHVITEEDIPKLLDIGKAHIYVLELGEGDLHEDDAALRLARALAGDDVAFGEPAEGKVTLKAQRIGLAAVDEAFVRSVNEIGDIALATVRKDALLRPGESIAAVRAIPLVIEERKIAAAEALAAEWRARHGGGPLSVRPLRSVRAGLLVTGSEVYSGRIRDRFGPVVRAKLEALGSEVAEQRFAPDDRQQIVTEIHYLLEQGYDMILVTGGMSVDPDDRTPGAIREAGADIVSYGTPMLPGSMLLVGYLGDVPILGLPGCVMHDPYTSFDVLLPRILAGDRITRDTIAGMGYGGLYHG
ncbi:MAG: molybdopterin-binding protein [Thermobacillus sp. ZCTH02-B1]|uniref:molybdopterin-binding protein n=1 Tax=Thermobacillus sp. ZCTH02-B1 TaxID=1858795 RepID=UPI000B56A015|nr:molybdopterin-binding protein [Thermobacillus sp. ZCTH02-B1]OUM94619.1 MAG: molybdopterin-binding protein [Thermobacillus sp. ZCTH02-B1]